MFDYRGGPNGIAPGATQSVLLNLDPGNYIALCVIPGTDGSPHAAHGMYAALTVTGDDAAVDLGTLDVEGAIALTDYDFAVSEGFDGKGNVLVSDNAAQAHEVAIYKMVKLVQIAG